MTSPVSMPAGHKMVATDFDAYENATAAWTSYTPAWTASSVNPALGNGTLTGNYTQVGKLVFLRIVLTMGSTSTFGTGAWSISLPVGAKASSIIGALAEDSSASQRWAGQVRIITTSATGDNMRIVVADASGAVNSTVPFTWATSDSLILSGLYEAA